MKNKKVNLAIFLVVAHLSASDLLASKPDDMDIVTVCKEHCPDAKTNAETHECVERKAKIRKTMKQTKCWEENEKYEKLAQDSKNSKK